MKNKRFIQSGVDGRGSPPSEPAALPPDVLEAIAQEEADEQAHLMRTWQTADLLLKAEPSDEVFERMGANIWANLQREINTSTPPSPLRLVKPQMVYWTAIAASIVILIGIGLTLALRPVSVMAPLGEVAGVQLPDGSTVELNSGSALTYSRFFNWRQVRAVELDGEAFFSVEKSGSPFVVQTFNARVTVLGTRFNVRAWQEERSPATKVTLESGAVKLASSASQAQAVTLKPGESSQLSAGALSPTTPAPGNIDYALAWRSGKFFLVNQPLEVILSEVEHRFGVQIKVSPEYLYLLEESLSYINENPESAASVLNDLSGGYNRYQFRSIPGGFELYEAGSR